MKQILAVIIFLLFNACASKKDTQYLQLGKAEMANQHFDEAAKLFTKSIEKNPANAESFFARGLNYNLLKDFESAVSDFNQAEKLGYTDAKLYTLRSFAYNMTEKNDLALQDLDKAIEMDPDSYAGNYYNRAMLQLSLKKPDLAMLDLNKYVEATQNPNGYFARGKIVLGKGDLKSACEDFKRAISFGSTDEELLKISDAICK